MQIRFWSCNSKSKNRKDVTMCKRHRRRYPFAKLYLKIEIFSHLEKKKKRKNTHKRTKYPFKSKNTFLPISTLPPPTLKCLILRFYDFLRIFVFWVVVMDSKSNTTHKTTLIFPLNVREKH